MRGFLVPFLQGGADAAWYGAVLADTMQQVRSGVFPIWAGQSIFQFNGAISPVRIAPAFNNVGALLDLATLHSMDPRTLLNTMLVSVALAAVASTYISLRSILPGKLWTAAGLTVLYMACPGILGLAYNGDLFMSWMTLPLVPLVFCFTVHSFRPEHQDRALLAIGAVLGMCWWGHAPIALWTTLFAACSQAARIAFSKAGEVRWMPVAGAAFLFCVIAAFPIGSVLFYPPDHGQSLSAVQKASPGTILYFLRDAFPGTLLPLTANGRSPGDFQFGYALWALLLYCIFFRFRGAPIETRILLVAAALLAVLVLPVPGISLIAWDAVPGFIRNPTGNWASPRLFMPMAAATVFALAADSGSAARPKLPPKFLASALIAAGCVWSLMEASKFAVESRLIAKEPLAMIDTLLPENLQLTRYSYGMFPSLPDTFTHGVTDPLLENRLLNEGSGAPFVENAKSAIALSEPVSAARFRKASDGASVIELDKPLLIEPGRSYLLELEIRRAEFAKGALQMAGSEFIRVYALPEHGGPRAFGIGGDHLGVIPVWTTRGTSEQIVVRFLPSVSLPLDKAVQFAAGARLLSYDPGKLPIRVDSWIPYSARISSPSAALLETPRMFQPGYEAWVDGAPAQVSKSPDGLVCVAVPAGSSSVRLRYAPPTGLRLLFWLSFIGAALSLAASAALLSKRSGARWRAAATGS